MKKQIARQAAEKNYDLIVVSHLSMMVYARDYGIPIILEQHNVESLILKRMAAQERSALGRIAGWIEYRKLRRFETRMLKIAAGVAALSEADKRRFIELAGTEIAAKTCVLPICLEQAREKDVGRNALESLTDPSRTPCKIKLLFVGTLTWHPNEQAMLWFLDHVYPRLDPNRFELVVIGGNPPEWLKRRQCPGALTVTGYVADLQPYIAAGDIQIVPIQAGSGQRVKIIEAFAKGLPTISTSVGAEGIQAVDGDNIIIADDAETFARGLEMMAADAALRRRLADRARATFESNYCFTRLPQQWNDIIAHVEMR